MRDRYYKIQYGHLIPVFTADYKVYLRAEDLEKAKKLSSEELQVIDDNIRARIGGREYVLVNLGHGEHGDFELGTCDLDTIEVPQVEVSPILRRHRVRENDHE